MMEKSLTFKPDWEETRERFVLWWNHEYFGRCALAVTAPRDNPPDAPSEMPAFASAGGLLPDSLKAWLPLDFSEGYGAGYLWSGDRHTLLAYVFNTTRWHLLPRLTLAGDIHRMPEAADLKIKIANLADRDHDCFLYDLNDKIPTKKAKIKRSCDLNIGMTDKDYFLLIRPG